MDDREIARYIQILGIDISHLEGSYRMTYPARTMMFKTFITVSDPIEYFRKAMETELEHGTVGPLTDVTGDDPLKTAKIAAAHLKGVEYGKKEFKEFPDYYDWLWYMESLHERAS